MRKILANIAVLGLVAAGATGLGATTASACVPGSTDCPFQPPYTLRSQPNTGVSGREFRYHRGDRDRRWNRDRWRRHHHRRRQHRNWRGGVPFFGFYYEQPSYRYRYVRPAPAYRGEVLPEAHINWCFRNYKTYRLRDNSFKPTVNTRRECVSPYWP